MVAVLSVIGLFLVRIGIPLTALIVMGTLIERHQTKQRAEAAKIYKLSQEVEQNTTRRAA